MPDPRPNPIARTIAVLALVGAFVLVVATIATVGGDGDDGDEGGDQTEGSGPTAQGRRALEEGVWVVRSGDTLVSISEQTAIDDEELIEMNPDLDPQVLVTGQRISLRPSSSDGGAGDAGGPGTTTNESFGGGSDSGGGTSESP